ncbi:MAG TPA: C4-dicarboxylate ABC transporter substrate-binding protein, partial [Ottowia sp.]|nr:C4-dicarboxylate ABC transporter substrate-binding protein [Ottowia sp.]
RLRRIEARLGEDPGERDALLNELDELDRLANQTAVPLAHADELYALRGHIEAVRRRALAQARHQA